MFSGKKATVEFAVIFDTKSGVVSRHEMHALMKSILRFLRLAVIMTVISQLFVPDANAKLELNFFERLKLGDETVLGTTETGGFWSSMAPTNISGSQRPVAITPLAVSFSTITVGNCSYQQLSDWPHISNNVDASVHGWWTRSSSSYCPSTAKVTAYLQASWCGKWGCSWVTVASGPGQVVYSGGGAGFRDNARVRCANRTTPVAYRGGTDVDLIGVNDPSGITWGPAREGANSLLCAPS
jgi:hypothetical protein